VSDDICYRVWSTASYALRSCSLQQTPPAAATAVATPAIDPTATDTEANDLLGDLLQGRPDDQLVVPTPAVQRIVVREVATQHEVAWADASTTIGRPSFNAGVHAGPPALTGPALLLRAGDGAVCTSEMKLWTVMPEKLVRYMTLSFKRSDLYARMMAADITLFLADSHIQRVCRFPPDDVRVNQGFSLSANR